MSTDDTLYEHDPFEHEDSDGYLAEDDARRARRRRILGIGLAVLLGARVLVWAVQLVS